jgi:hypothetical protein
MPKSKVRKKTATIQGQKHVVTQKPGGDVMLNHPDKKSGTSHKKMDLTEVSNGRVKNLQQGIEGAKKWHSTHRKTG